jgi:hypothetical protein
MIRVIIGALVLASCSTPPATEQEKNEAVSLYIECLAKAIPAMDDGRSDAQTIALAARSRCYNAYRTARETFVRHHSPGSQAAFVREGENDLSFETAAVLDLRARAMRGEQ